MRRLQAAQREHQPVPHRLHGLRPLSRRRGGGGTRALPDDDGARRARPDDLPAEARDLGKRLRCATVALGAGHAVMTETPDALQRALIEALA